MTNSFETAGFWHVPDNPSRKIAGTLRYSAEDGLRLALTGSFGEWPSGQRADSYPTIHGIVHDSPFGKAFTLVDCFRTMLSVQMPGFATEEVFANHAYAGDHWPTKDNLLFGSAALELSALDNWIDTSGISCRPPKERADAIQMEYARPESIPIALDDQTLKIDFGWSRSQSLRAYSFREKVGIKIDGLGRMPQDQIAQQYIYPLQNFFTFATDHPSAIGSTVFYSRDMNSADLEQSSAFHYLAQPIYLLKETEKQLQSHDMLFTYEDVKDDLPRLFRRWFDFTRVFKPFCLSYFGLLYAPDRFIDERFRTLIESLVLFFRTQGESDQSFHLVLNETIRSFQTHCEGRNSHWLADVMPTAADLALPWNLLAALERHRDVMTPLTGDNIERFVDKIVATRRYCQYRDPALVDRAAQGAELFWLTEKVKVLVKMLILEHLGIPCDLVTKCVKRNRVYSHLVGLADTD